VSSARAYDDRGWAVASYLSFLAPWLLFDRTRSSEARWRAADAVDLGITAFIAHWVLWEVLDGVLEPFGVFLVTLPVGAYFFVMAIGGALNSWRGVEWTTPLTVPLARTWFSRRVERRALQD
jgi:hypothetical protein